MPRRKPHAVPSAAAHAALLLFVVFAGALDARRLSAQAGPSPGTTTETSTPSPAPSLTAVRVVGRAPAIDGRLDEEVWRGAPVATDFLMSRPRPGQTATLRTEARVAADDDALYVAVRAYDPHPDSILAPYPRRDDEGTSDWIFVEIDSRHDRRSGFSFGINPRGVQADGAWSNDTDYDSAWDGVWDGAARIDSLGWTAELRIPFSQLALPARRDGEAVLGLNVYRFAPHRGEVSNWSPRLPSVVGIVSHFRELRGVPLPRTVQRVQLVPYLSTRAAQAPARTGDAKSAALPRGGDVFAGADLRVRLTPAFALAGAVRPDFGQVEADPSGINLTSFESFFPEKRPFFVDGAERFVFDPATTALPGGTGLSGIGVPFQTRGINLGDDVPFYSRRIGRRTHTEILDGLYVHDATPTADIVAAAKVTGRSEGGWTLGVLAATTERETARVAAPSGVTPSSSALVTVPVEPPTDFLVARVSREGREGRSALGGMLTGVSRRGLGDSPLGGAGATLADRLTRSALLAGVDGRRRFGEGSQAYELSGFVAASRAEGSAHAIRALAADGTHNLLRADASHLARYRNDSTLHQLEGASAQLRVAKPAGHWLWSLTGHTITPGFSTNDVGFERSSDWVVASGTLAYQSYQPGRIFRRWAIGLGQLGASWTTAGERRGAAASLRADGELRSEWGGSVTIDHDLATLDMDALRGGPALYVPARTKLSAQLHGDSRRLMQWSVRGHRARDAAGDGRSTKVVAGVETTFGDRLHVGVEPGVTRSVEPSHFVGIATDTGSARVCDPAPRPCYTVARLTQTTATLTAVADLSFSARSTLQLYAQPLIGTATYDRFATVVSPRARDAGARTRPSGDAPPAGVTDPSFSKRHVIGTAVWRWEYRPGSTLFVVATQSRGGANDDSRWDTGGAMHDLARDPGATVVQIKWSYWWQP